MLIIYYYYFKLIIIIVTVNQNPKISIIESFVILKKIKAFFKNSINFIVNLVYFREIIIFLKHPKAIINLFY